MRFLLATTLLCGCTIRHAEYPPPAETPAVRTADGAEAATDCFESTTPAERLACADPAARAAAVALARALQRDLRDAGLFGRDALLADQRAWIVGTGQRCHLDVDAGSQARACLQAATQARTAALARPPSPPPHQTPDAAALYVSYAVERDFGARLCPVLAAAANAAIARAGEADPAAMPGAQELAGSHGAAQATLADGVVAAIDLHDAKVFGLYARRARALSLGGRVVLDDLALGALAEQARNAGGRFSRTASQTGDYAAIDVLRFAGVTGALIAEPWGPTAPAAPGEFARAGFWRIEGATAAPACLFTIAKTPDDSLPPPLAAWMALLAQVGGPPALGVAALRDEAQFRAAARFTVLHEPLLAIQQARGWTGWLRHRHDAGLDTLAAWSARDAASRQTFDEIFAGLRAAATALVAFYQQGQALGPDEARQAAGIAIMELLYGAALDAGFAPDDDRPEARAGYTPRHPILAVPQ